MVPTLGRSGGVGAVLAHARGLAADHGMHVTLAVEGAEAAPASGVRTIPLAEAREESFDVAVATWWRTASELFDVPADRRAYFLQSFEERLYRPGDVERLAASITHGLPLSFITEGRWIAELLAEVRPDAPCFHVANGVSKELFAGPDAPPRTDRRAPLRVLVEGSPNLWFKGVDSAVAAAARMTRERTVTLVSPEQTAAPPAVDRVLGPLELDEMPAVYAETDVLLKLSRVEGVFTPPLEAFHLGATCVTSPVTGHDEYVVHGRNGIVAEWDDLPGTARWLDLLAEDRELLHELRRGALATAQAWPSWEQSTAQLAEALREISAAPPPPAETAIAQVLADLRAGIEELRREQVAAERKRLRNERALAARVEDLSEQNEWRERRHAELTATRSHRLAARLQRAAAIARRVRRAVRRQRAC